MPAGGSDPGGLGATPIVSVVGEAVVRAEPDEAMVVVTLSALEDSPGPALANVARHSDALLTLLDELAIVPADRSTTGVSVQEDFDHTAAGSRSIGHRAVSAIAVRLVELEVIGRLVTRATTELDARVDGPRWQIAPQNPLRLEAARLAAADGQRRAQAYAEGVGAHLGALVRLTEPESAGFSRRHGVIEMSAASAGGMAVEAGEQQIIATIEVTFTLIPGPG